MKPKTSYVQPKQSDSKDALGSFTNPEAVKALMSESEKISEIDRLTLELAKERRQTVLAEAKTALAKNENADLTYKYVVMQIYMKYNLTAADLLNETGEIVRGGALKKEMPGS